jgi:hypothetical protein
MGERSQYSLRLAMLAYAGHLSAATPPYRLGHAMPAWHPGGVVAPVHLSLARARFGSARQPPLFILNHPLQTFFEDQNFSVLESLM